MRSQKKGFILGFFAALALVIVGQALFVTTASARTGRESVTLDYADIKICIDGQYITPTDAAGSPVEPFIINGTTYLPVRAVANALGKAVDWDGETKTVFLGQKPAAGTVADGTRANPLTGTAGVTVTHNSYSSEPTRQANIKVLNIFTGEAANYMAAQAASENMNRLPAAGEEYVFFEVEFKYIASSKGEDDSFNPSGAVTGTQFFSSDGSALSVSDRTYIMSYGAFANYEPKSIYPGGTSKFLVGALVNKGYDKILLKVPNNSDRKNETNTWILMNSTDKVVSTVDAVKSHFNLDQGSNTDHTNDPIKITLKNSLPETISEYSGSSRRSSALITDFSYTVSSTSASIAFTGEKTYDVEGSGQSRAVKVGWKLYDGEGYVVKSGTANSTSIKVGEKFKNCKDTIYGLEPGDYTMEIMGVN